MPQDSADELSDNRDSEIQSLLSLACEKVVPDRAAREQAYARVLSAARQAAQARPRRVSWLPLRGWVGASALVAAAVALVFVGMGLWRNFSPGLSIGTLTVEAGSARVNSPDRPWPFRSGDTVRTVQAGGESSLRVGDAIETGPGEQAQILFFDGSDVRIGEESRLAVEVVEPARRDTPPRFELRMWRGSTSHRVVAMQQVPRYQVHTPSVSVMVRGTAFDVLVFGDDETYVRCTQGLVDVVSGEQVATVRAGEELAVAAGESLRASAQVPPAPHWVTEGTTLITNADSITLAGSAQPRGRVVISADGAPPVSRRADGEGRFSYEFTSAEDADFVIRVAEVVTGGVSSEWSEVVTVRFDRIPPPLRITQPTSPQTTSDSVLLTGRTEPGATVSVNESEVTVDRSGGFAHELSLAIGDNRVGISTMDEAGNRLTFSMTVVRR